MEFFFIPDDDNCTQISKDRNGRNCSQFYLKVALVLGSLMVVIRPSVKVIDDRCWDSNVIPPSVIASEKNFLELRELNPSNIGITSVRNTVFFCARFYYALLPLLVSAPFGGHLQVVHKHKYIQGSHYIFNGSVE
jgi:hypothetical protein